MAENDNPSIVNDASGNNYGGISSGGTMGQATMAYLENLQRLATKMPPKPLSQLEYMPGEAQGIQQGQVSGSIIGSQPIFAASNLIPFAMMDEMRRSAAEAEVDYYKNLKTYLNKPLTDAKLKLNNPAAQPAFANKLQQTTDQMLALHTNRQGGNPIMGRIALQNDPEFLKFLDSASQYADMYNTVNTKALDVVAKMAEPSKYFVSDEEKASVNKFLSTQDIFNKDNAQVTFDGLVKSQNEFATKESVFQLAETATKGIQENIIEDFSRDPSVRMSTDKMNVWIKTRTTGSKKQAEDLYNEIVKTNDYGPEQNALLKKEIQARVKYGVEKSITQLEKNGAEEKLALKKMGVDVQEDGSIQFTTTRSALVPGVGENAVNFPNITKPIPTFTGMDGYVLYKGTIRHVKTDQSFNMIPKAEYDVKGEAAKNIFPDRYVETNLDFKSQAAYEAERYYQIHGVPMPVGEAKGTTQVQEATLTDVDTGEVFKILGNQTMLVPSNQLNKTIEANYPGMDYVHQQLDMQSGKYPYDRRRDFPGRSMENPIDVPEGGDLSLIKDDPGVFYRSKTGKIAAGNTIHELVRKQNK